MEWKDLLLQNAALNTWSEKTQIMLRSSAEQFRYGKKGTVRLTPPAGAKWKAHDEAKLKASIGKKIYKKYDVSEGVGFKIERHGVFVQKGVGRGYKMINGVVVRTAKHLPMDQQASNHKWGFGIKALKLKGKKVGRGPASGRKRRPVDWFNSSINVNLPDLADQIAIINANAVINSLHINIK